MLLSAGILRVEWMVSGPLGLELQAVGSLLVQVLGRTNRTISLPLSCSPASSFSVLIPKM